MKRTRVGICGYGGLGRLHAANLAKMKDIEVVSVCDANPEKLKGDRIATNIKNSEPVFDIGKCATHTDYRRMLKEEKPDAVISALPSHLHAEFAVAAMNAGSHVFTEKPMALNTRDCKRMLAERNKTGKELMIGQCLRFWPEYEFLKKTSAGGKLGKLKSLLMTRLGNYCTWANPNWFLDGRLSGGAILDLHLHDVDWAYYAFGRPKSICASGVKGRSRAIDDVTTVWNYRDFIVTMRGSWLYHGFHMSYQAFFENGILEYGIAPDTCLKIKLAGEKDYKKVAVPQMSAYFAELGYFFECIGKKHKNKTCPPESTMESVRLVELENKSIRLGRQIRPHK